MIWYKILQQRQKIKDGYDDINGDDISDVGKYLMLLTPVMIMRSPVCSPNESVDCRIRELLSSFTIYTA